MSKNDQFSTIINSIDIDIKIIVDNKTGFYNITKINNYIYEQICMNTEPTGIPVGSKKLINDWTRSKSNQELIKELQKQLKTDDELIIKINDVNDEFKGTYVHKYLFEHILMWIDKSYAIKISIILNQNHIDYNKKLENKLIKKNCKIAELSKKMDLALAALNNQGIKIDDLKLDNMFTHTKLIKAEEDNMKTHTKLNESNNELKIMNNHLEIKSKSSTMDPVNLNKVHGFALLSREFIDNGVNKGIIRMVSGQNQYVKGRVDEFIENYPNCSVERFYQANGIDLKENSRVAIKNDVDDIRAIINHDNKLEVAENNQYWKDTTISTHQQLMKSLKSVLKVMRSIKNEHNGFELDEDIMNDGDEIITKVKHTVKKVINTILSYDKLQFINYDELYDNIVCTIYNKIYLVILKNTESNVKKQVLAIVKNHKHEDEMLELIEDEIPHIQTLVKLFIAVHKFEDAINEFEDKFIDYESKEMHYKSLTKSDMKIFVNINNSTIKYEENDHITFDKLRQIIINKNTDTQNVPHIAQINV